MSDIIRFSLRRLLQGVGIVIGVSIFLFILLRSMPLDPVELMESPEFHLSLEEKSAITQAFGLNEPIYRQYFVWVGGIARGDFGLSMKYRCDVLELIGPYIPYTLTLSLWTLFFIALIAIPIGLALAYRHNRFSDRAFLVLSIVLNAIPPFWFGFILIYLLSYRLGLFPMTYEGGVISWVLPIFTNVFLGFGTLARFVRSEVLGTKRERFVMTAYSKGLSQRRVMTLHVLRNAMIPIFIMFITNLPYIISGSVIIEMVFGMPGMGTLLLVCTQALDFPVVQTLVLFISVLVVLCNVMGDIATALLDPRARQSFGKGVPT